MINIRCIDSMSLAGIDVEFLCDEAPYAYAFQKHNTPLRAAGKISVQLKLNFDGIPKIKPKEKLFESGSTWTLYLSQGKYLLSNSVLEAGTPFERMLVMDSGLITGDLYAPDGSSLALFPARPLPYPLDQVLTIMLLSRGRGFLLHACGIDDHGAGYLFAGNSGHGKSTMAKLWHDRGASVLNDDRIVLREKDGAFWMYGTPWHGDFKEHAAEEGLPVQKIFFLSQGNPNTASRKHGTEAVTMLLTRAFPPLWDKEGMAFTMDFCHVVTQKVSCYELNFFPDERVIDFVRNT